MRYSELIENTDSDDDLFAKPLADRIRARLAELEDQDFMEPEDMIDQVAEEFNLEVEQVYDLLDDEVYENTDDDDLFGGSDRGTPSPEKAVAKFKMFFPINKRVSWSKMHFGTVDRLFGFSTDSRFHAGASYDRHSYWGTQAYTNRQTGLGLLIYEDSGQGTWAYLGAQSREDMAHMIQQLIAADQLEDPEAAKQRRLAKQQGRAAAAEKKGIRVGAKIRVPYQGQTATAEVVSISKAGKLNLRMIDGPDAGQLHSWQPSAHSVRKADVLGENDDDDDELFGEPRSYMFIVAAPDDEIVGNYKNIEDALDAARFLVDDYLEAGYEDTDAIRVMKYKTDSDGMVDFDEAGVTVGTIYLGTGELAENFDDDDMFATPTIKFADLFNEYDEDQLMVQGFQYGDHPEQDIEILNDYLEGYKDFRVVGISGGEHDLVLHLDRSSKLKETDDEELFGEPVNKKIAKWLHNYAVRMQQEPDHWSAFSADEGDEYENDIAEIKEQGQVLQSIAQTFATEGLKEGLRVFGYRAHEYDNWWWDRIAPELNDETGISLEDLVDEINIGESENPDHDDNELFGSPALTAAKIGKLLGAAGVTSGEIVDPESVNLALHRIAALDKYRIRAEIMQQQWLNMDEDTAWNMVDDIANVVYDINGDGWEPEDTIYNESDDELFGKKWHERINMSSIELDGIDRSDSPDFSDAHVSYAEFDDGKPLNNEQLEWLTNELGSTGELHELVWDSLHEGQHAL